MSRSSSISLRISNSKETEIVALVIALLEFGWSTDDYGQVSFLPVGDVDDFNWNRGNLSQEELLTCIKEKSKLKEIAGVVLTWKDTGIGGQFLFWNDGTILINLNVNRKKINEDLDVTDVNWYLQKIILALSNYLIEKVSFEECV